MSKSKTELIEKILNLYREKTDKPDEFYLEKFDYLSDQTDARLQNYMKVLENLDK